MAEALPDEGQGGRSLGNPETALTCGVCLSDFDAEYRRPLLLPSCGHTFCRVCIKDMATGGDLVCPVCRCKYQNSDPDSFPINFNIQVLASAGKSSKINAKGEVAGGDCVNHGVRLAFWCRACEAPACGECLYESHPRPSHTICRIQDVVKEIKMRAQALSKESCEEVVLRLGEILQRVLQDVSDLQEASHLLQESARVNRSSLACLDLPSITTVFESAKNVRQRVSDLDHSDGGSLRPNLRAVLGPRPVVVALSETGGLAQVKVEEKGIHIYCLRPSSIAYSVAVKLNVLMGCVNKEAPEVFLDLKAGERPIGRVYITLWAPMKRAQQFMALCLGNLGPSYRGTKFDGVSERAQPGEYVRGGDYQGRGGLGGEALMDNLEWGEPWSRPKAAGQVCGVGGEEERKFGALFAICLRDNPSDTFRGPFGMVTSGLEAIEVASRHDPLYMVRVADCGVVIPV